MKQNAEYQVVLTKQARKLFNKIKDRREQQLLLAKLEKLKHNPNIQGKALVFVQLVNVIELSIKFKKRKF